MLKSFTSIKIMQTVGTQWLTPVILAMQEAEIRRITSSKPAPGK
jgi:hypothetical protein